MNIRQWEIWKARPHGFQQDHWFVVISNQERCDSPRLRQINGLACFTLRGQAEPVDFVLNGADGFAGPTACGCDFLYTLDKQGLHSSLGTISWERQQQIKSKIKSLLRI